MPVGDLHGSRAVLTVDSLVKSFGGVYAVNDVSFTVDRGEIVALVGPNGAGKTTCLHMIAGTMRPDAGHVSLHQQRLRRLSVAARYRRGMRRTYQHPVFPTDALVDEWLNADRAIVAAHGRKSGRKLEFRYFSSIVDGAAKVSHDSSLNPAADRRGQSQRIRRDTRIERLSPGQRHLLETFRVCSGNPALLLLDEPTSGMDVADVDTFSIMLRRVVADGSAALLVTHDVPLAVRLANRMIVMNFGRIIAEGAPDQVLRRPEVIDSYLGRRSARILLEPNTPGASSSASGPNGPQHGSPLTRGNQS